MRTIATIVAIGAASTLVTAYAAAQNFTPVDCRSNPVWQKAVGLQRDLQRSCDRVYAWAKKRAESGTTGQTEADSFGAFALLNFCKHVDKGNEVLRAEWENYCKEVFPIKVVRPALSRC